MPGSVFISYRRSGDGMAAGRLHRELSDLLGREQVFMDVDDIPMGVDFHDYLDSQVARCDVFLAIIGPGWVDAVPRLASPDDFVRIEIESALARKDIRIIPLLIDDAEMPATADLPDSLHPLTRRNGGRLTHAGFTDTVRRLARQIQMPLPGAAPVSVPPTPVVTHEPEPDEHLVKSTGDPPHSRDVGGEAKEVRTRSRLPWFLGATAAAGIAAFAFLGPFGGDDVPEVPQGVEQPAEELLVEEAAAQEPTDPYPDLSTFQDCDECPTMVVIPAGSFLMGSPEDEEGRKDDEGPQREVTVPKFGMAQTEVTFDQWQACVDGGGCQSNPAPHDRGWGRGSRPVISVNWYDALEYVDWLNTKVEGTPYRLPSEAEWEYSARAGTKGRFSNDGGKADLCAIANHADLSLVPVFENYGEDGNSGANLACSDGFDERMAPVASFQPNAFTLYDMHGNVSEWVEDVYGPYFDAPTDGSAHVPQPVLTDHHRVVRGGSWGFIPPGVRSADRLEILPEEWNDFIGFRPARTLP